MKSNVLEGSNSEDAVVVNEDEVVALLLVILMCYLMMTYNLIQTSCRRGAVEVVASVVVTEEVEVNVANVVAAEEAYKIIKLIVVLLKRPKMGHKVVEVEVVVTASSVMRLDILSGIVQMRAPSSLVSLGCLAKMR